MHNKLLVADGVAAVIGGRNIANAYYLRGMNDNFIDLDAFVVGQVVVPLAALSTATGTATRSTRIQAVAQTDSTPESLRAYFDRATGPDHTEPPANLPQSDILGYGPLRDDFEFGRLGLIWGDAYVFADYPEKPFEGEVGGNCWTAASPTTSLKPSSRRRRKC